MEKVLRMAVIGCGFFGEKHADVIGQIFNAKLVAVCDVQEKIAKKVAEKNGVPFYTDYNKMFANETLDAVSIAVSEPYHLEVSAAAANNGLHIFLEKPIARNVEEAKKIKKVAEDNHVRLMIGHVGEFDGRYRYTADAIDAGDLGEIISMYFKRSTCSALAERLQGKISMFHYMGVHDFEAMLLFAKPALPVKVYSAWVAKKNSPFMSHDTVFNTITFDNGIVACIQLCWALPNSDALGLVICAEVVGTKGVSYIDIKNQGLELHTEKGVSYPDLTYWPEYFGHVSGKLKEEFQHFVDCTLNQKKYIVDTELAIEAVRTIDCCMLSLNTGMPVEVKR